MRAVTVMRWPTQEFPPLWPLASHVSHRPRFHNWRPSREGPSFISWSYSPVVQSSASIVRRDMDWSHYYMWPHVHGSQDTSSLMVVGEGPEDNCVPGATSDLHRCHQRCLSEVQSPNPALRIWLWDPGRLISKKHPTWFVCTFAFYNSGLRNRAGGKAMRAKVKEASRHRE